MTADSAGAAASDPRSGGRAPNAPAVRIAIADPHPIFSDGLARLLGTDARFTIVGRASSEDAIVALVRSARPDVLLLGLAGSGTHGFAALRTLSDAALGVRTILLIDRVDRPDVIAALRFGVRAIIPKDSTPDLLARSIVRVMTEPLSASGDPEAGAASVQRLAAARRRTQAFGLTRRETQILREVVAGHTNKAIARHAAISENTVKTHVGSLFNKLGASNRVELALFALHHRLLDGV